MKTRNDCEIACDCVKLANVVLHVGLCKEIIARKHTATHKPTSAQSAHMTTMTHTSNNRLWSPLAYGLGAISVCYSVGLSFLKIYYYTDVSLQEMYKACTPIASLCPRMGLSMKNIQNT